MFDLFKSPISLSNVLIKNALTKPKSDALVWKNNHWNFSYLNKQVSKLANAFLASGCKKGQFIGCFLPKIPEFVVSFLATIRAGLIYIPLNSNSNTELLKKQLITLHPSWLIIESNLYELISSLLEEIGLHRDIRVLIVSNNFYRIKNVILWKDLFYSASSLNPRVSPNINDIAYINYTSGTTGIPKGAITTNVNIYWNSVSAIHELHLTENDVHLCLFPSHIHPHETIARSIYLGGTIVLSDNSMDNILNNLNEKYVTCIMANQSFYQLLAHHTLARNKKFISLKIAESGGSLTPTNLIKIYKDQFNVQLVPVWGSTETTGIAIAAYDFDFNLPDGLLGKPCIYYRLTVFDNNRMRLKTNQVGELAIRGPGVTKGYYNGVPEDSRCYSKGWYFTQDLVYQDEKGNFYFQSRYNDMIKTGGMKVYPTEIESILLKHPGIIEVAVIGIRSSIRGETIKVVIACNKNMKLTTKEVIDFCKENQLQDYKLPRIIKIVKKLPRYPSGKVNKEKLKQEDNYNV